MSRSFANIICLQIIFIRKQRREIGLRFVANKQKKIKLI